MYLEESRMVSRRSLGLRGRVEAALQANGLGVALVHQMGSLQMLVVGMELHSLAVEQSSMRRVVE